MGKPAPGPDTPDRDAESEDTDEPLESLDGTSCEPPHEGTSSEPLLDRASDEPSGVGRDEPRVQPADAVSGVTRDEPSPEGHSDSSGGGEGEVRQASASRSRRPPKVTRDTARPEGGGRAAPGDAPAPARQWPLLTVIGLAALGLLIVGTDPFPQSFRVGTVLVGVALLTGAVLRRVLPSVGMLAVRSRFTDMVTYGLLGVVIVLLALMAQPEPWLEIPFLEDAVRFTLR
ncbi:DUF3017 domain-containing protein [Streptomyces sp. SCSIO 30461]|uniref:DUF3017 domain-containing protein n=1 Tax=Streptomyces sp. SCSIO 30461 TaxID=3118085 RepID=UPI0030CF671D